VDVTGDEGVVGNSTGTTSPATSPRPTRSSTAGGPERLPRPPVRPRGSPTSTAS